MQKIAVIGAGNMGGAVALGLHRLSKDASITVTAAHASTLDRFTNIGIHATLDNVSAASRAAMEDCINNSPDIPFRDLYYRLFTNTVGSHVMIYNAPAYGSLFRKTMREYLK